jgi:hypothetical protein
VTPSTREDLRSDSIPDRQAGDNLLARGVRKEADPVQLQIPPHGRKRLVALRDSERRGRHANGSLSRHSIAQGESELTNCKLRQGRIAKKLAPPREEEAPVNELIVVTTIITFSNLETVFNNHFITSSFSSRSGSNG